MEGKLLKMQPYMYTNILNFPNFSLFLKNSLSLDKKKINFKNLVEIDMSELNCGMISE